VVNLHDRQGRTADEASDDVTWAVGALTAATPAAQADADTPKAQRRAR